MSIRIRDKATGAELAQVSEADLAVLAAYMEEESSTDQDYFVDLDTVDVLESQGASAGLVAALRAAIGDSEGIDIAWDRA